MRQIRLLARAKVNLTLDVVGRRNDGYHLLQSVMQSVTLADFISLHKQETGIAVRTDCCVLPRNEQNSCWKSANVFQQYTGITEGVVIEIKKTIPLMAGLGGGSTDAAAVLYGLDKLFKTDLSKAELQDLGLQVGADVPFCLQGGTAYVEGIGERVTPLPSFPTVFIVLVKPRGGISTAEVYANLSPQAFGGSLTQELITGLQTKRPLATLALAMGNALETVTGRLMPSIGLWKERLLQAGAMNAVMSGSGTTVFGMFSSAEAAHAFQSKWAKTDETYVVQPAHTGVVLMNGGD